AGIRLEEEDAAVVAAGEDENRPLPGRGAGKREREQVCLRPGVAEPDELDGRKPLAHRGRKSALKSVRSPERDPARESVANRVENYGVRMAVETGGGFAEEVDVLVSVDVDEPRTFPTGNRERERVELDDPA